MRTAHVRAADLNLGDRVVAFDESYDSYEGRVVSWSTGPSPRFPGRLFARVALDYAPEHAPPSDRQVRWFAHDTMLPILVDGATYEERLGRVSH